MPLATPLWKSDGTTGGGGDGQGYQHQQRQRFLDIGYHMAFPSLVKHLLQRRNDVRTAHEWWWRMERTSSTIPFNDQDEDSPGDSCYTFARIHDPVGNAIYFVVQTFFENGLTQHQGIIIGKGELPGSISCRFPTPCQWMKNRGDEYTPRPTSTTPFKHRTRQKTTCAGLESLSSSSATNTASSTSSSV